MNGKALLARLDELGVALVAEGDRLKVNAPRGRLDDGLKQAIGTHKVELLELLAARVAKPAAAITRIDRGTDLPLSYFQERLWVIQRLEPESTAYNIVAAWPAPEGTDAAHVVEAVGAVIARHETLRATFVDAPEAPRARLLDAARVRPGLVDLSDLPTADQDARFRAELDAAAQRPFDLANEAPARCTVYRLGPSRCVVLLAAHHIAVDAWSIDLLVREIASRCSGVVPEADPDALQYFDFAAWQRRAQDPKALRADLDWWADTLEGAPPVSAFPPDRAPAAKASGATFDFECDAALTAQLHALAREEGATIYMALLAACAAVLGAHTGQGDVVLGSPMGVRERPELEAMVGPFVNLQVVRLDLHGDPGFALLLRRARNALLDAYAHRDVPFEMLVERIKPARSLNHAPLFQVAVVQHTVSRPGTVAIRGGGALNDLTWFAHEMDGRIACTLEYRSDLYTAQFMERVALQLQALLRSAVADRHRPISRAALLAPGERERLLVDFNDTTIDLDPAPFAVQFERHAARTPERVAVTFEGQALSYGELNRRANQLARYLQGRGVGSGKLVALLMERSPQMIVALVAIQKAGGAYLPLDPGFPTERLAFMLDDSGSEVLVTDGAPLAGIDPLARVAVVDVRAQAAMLEAMEGGNLATAANPDDPAYVIYTSGSTGRPKGVVVPHRALANFLGSMAREPGLGADDVLAAVTTISFDIAALELYLPLVVGARVQLLSRETAADGVALALALAQSGATVLQATPATWRMLLESQWKPGRAMRAFCGGETLPRELAQALLERVDALWNLYGPTETTVWSTAQRVVDAAEVSIGRPIANTQVYILGSDREPVPVSMTGEIWIGGAGVASGYHRRPELTGERFTPDRFTRKPGARIYRTGDLGRWDAQGRLHHLGRVDHQVKVRGFRIELGEIEAVLGTNPAVRQCVVMALEASPNDARLVAYVVYHPGEEPTVSEVRRLLRRQVPDYMVPSVIVALDSIPLTPNGKTDRAALPDPFRIPQRVAHGAEPPAPGMEQMLAGVWGELLQANAIGAHDNFFELGGHSLLSLRVAVAVEQKTGWRMDPRTMFFQTLRQVAAAYPGPAPGTSAPR